MIGSSTGCSGSCVSEALTARSQRHFQPSFNEQIGEMRCLFRLDEARHLGQRKDRRLAGRFATPAEERRRVLRLVEPIEHRRGMCGCEDLRLAGQRQISQQLHEHSKTTRVNSVLDLLYGHDAGDAWLKEHSDNRREPQSAVAQHRRGIFPAIFLQHE